MPIVDIYVCVCVRARARARMRVLNFVVSLLALDVFYDENTEEH
jgi:hypothetical protein